LPSDSIQTEWGPLVDAAINSDRFYDEKPFIDNSMGYQSNKQFDSKIA
jgi:hypothetical protein